MRAYGRSACCLLAAGLLTLPAVSTAPAVEFGPQGIVRQFCQADGLGQRAGALTWAALAPLVEWQFEPAWDDIVLVSTYTVGSPRPGDDYSFAVDVRYQVIGHVSAHGFEATAYVDTVTFRVHAPDLGGWRIMGPPPAPHVFANRVDLDAMRRSLQPGTPDFLTNSSFVWQMYRSAQWNVDYVRTADLLATPAYRPVSKPKPGDLAVYLRDGTPYHVGLLEADDRLVSSTLNAGIVRTPLDGFAGDLQYLRLVDPGLMPTADEATATPETEPTEQTVSAPAAVAPRRTPTPKPGTKRKAQGKSRKKAKPSSSARVKKKSTPPRAKRPSAGATAATPGSVTSDRGKKESK